MHFLLCIIISISWCFVYETIDRSVEAGTISFDRRYGRRYGRRRRRTNWFELASNRLFSTLDIRFDVGINLIILRIEISVSRLFQRLSATKQIKERATASANFSFSPLFSRTMIIRDASRKNNILINLIIGLIGPRCVSINNTASRRVAAVRSRPSKRRRREKKGNEENNFEKFAKNSRKFFHFFESLLTRSACVTSYTDYIAFFVYACVCVIQIKKDI